MYNYNEFKGKVIDEVVNKHGYPVVIKFTDGTSAEIYNQGEIIDGEIELEIDLLED